MRILIEGMTSSLAIVSEARSIRGYTVNSIYVYMYIGIWHMYVCMYIVIWHMYVCMYIVIWHMYVYMYIVI